MEEVVTIKTGRPKAENVKSKSLTIRMSEETYQKLIEFAANHKKTMTEVALRSLEEYLAKQK